MAKSLILAGIILIVIGLLVILAQRFPAIGRLPGDIIIKRENFTFYFPVTTCILASVVISAILFFLGRR